MLMPFTTQHHPRPIGTPLHWFNPGWANPRRPRSAIVTDAGDAPGAYNITVTVAREDTGPKVSHFTHQRRNCMVMLDLPGPENWPPHEFAVVAIPGHSYADSFALAIGQPVMGHTPEPEVTKAAPLAPAPAPQAPKAPPPPAAPKTPAKAPAPPAKEPVTPKAPPRLSKEKLQVELSKAMEALLHYPVWEIGMHEARVKVKKDLDKKHIEVASQFGVAILRVLVDFDDKGALYHLETFAGRSQMDLVKRNCEGESQIRELCIMAVRAAKAAATAKNPKTVRNAVEAAMNAEPVLPPPTPDE